MNARPPTGRAELEARLIRRSRRDPAFLTLLQSDPRAAVELELGVQLPAWMTVDIEVERPDRLVIVIPTDVSEMSAVAVRTITGASPRAKLVKPDITD